MVITAGWCWLRLPPWKTCAVRKQQRLDKSWLFFLLRMASELFLLQETCWHEAADDKDGTVVAVTSGGAGLSFLNPC